MTTAPLPNIYNGGAFRKTSPVQTLSCRTMCQRKLTPSGEVYHSEKLLHGWMHPDSYAIKIRYMMRPKPLKISKPSNVGNSFVLCGQIQRKTKGIWSIEALRRTRVKFDAFSMLLFRAFFRSLVVPMVSFYLYMDASPQWRGLELFAASFDVLSIGVHRYLKHRLFPQVSIGPLVHTALGKACATLWMIWLMVGPSFQDVRNFCCRARGINTDLGTEHLAPSIGDVLIEFFVHIGCYYQTNAPRLQFLFPRALGVSGWHHTFDGLIRYGLSSLPWFTSFLEHLKSLVSFLRNQSTDLEAHLAGLDMAGASAILNTLTYVTFAE